MVHPQEFPHCYVHVPILGQVKDIITRLDALEKDVAALGDVKKQFDKLSAVPNRESTKVRCMIKMLMLKERQFVKAFDKVQNDVQMSLLQIRDRFGM